MLGDGPSQFPHRLLLTPNSGPYAYRSHFRIGSEVIANVKVIVMVVLLTSFVYIGKYLFMHVGTF